MIKSIFGLCILTGLLMADLVRDDTNEVVNDTRRYVMWQDNSDVQTVTKSWQGAINYCEDLNFAGYDDWRLPNINEILTIVDMEKYPAILNSFVNIKNESYWSSTTDVTYTSYKWTIKFGRGTTFSELNTRSYYVRCVRDSE